MSKKFTICGLLCCVIVFIASCAEEKTITGSCKTGQLSDQSALCINYYDSDNTAQWRQACNDMMQGQWSSSACDTSSALGGCRAGNKVIWYYPSEKHGTVEQAEQTCVNKGRVFVPGKSAEADIELK